jgi:hypothetical protein
MKESFFKKYISIYPAHLDFEEHLYVTDASDLHYFFSIPSKKKLLLIYDVVDLENILYDQTKDESTKELNFTSDCDNNIK